MKPILILLRATVLALAIQGCGSTPTREYLDESSAATIAVGNGAWIFARERSDLAIHAQDYITITPVQVNRSGAKTLYLYCHIWSTIDRRQGEPLLPSQTELTLIVDDRTLSLNRYESDLRKAGFGHPPIAAPNRAAELRLIAIDPAFLRYMSRSDQVRIAMNTGVNTDYFLSWRDGRNTFSAFANSIDDTRTPHR